MHNIIDNFHKNFFNRYCLFRERNYTEESKIFGVVGIAVLYPGSYGLFVNTYPDCQKESFKLVFLA